MPTQFLATLQAEHNQMLKMLQRLTHPAADEDDLEDALELIAIVKEQQQ